jgi:hypothetical protein
LGPRFQELDQGVVRFPVSFVVLNAVAGHLLQLVPNFLSTQLLAP